MSGSDTPQTPNTFHSHLRTEPPFNGSTVSWAKAKTQSQKKHMRFVKNQSRGLPPKRLSKACCN